MKLIQENNFYYLVNRDNERISNNYLNNPYEFTEDNNYIYISTGRDLSITNIHNINNFIYDNIDVDIIEVYGNNGRCFKDFIMCLINGVLYMKEVIGPYKSIDYSNNSFKYVIYSNIKSKYPNTLFISEINPYLIQNELIKNDYLINEYKTIKYSINSQFLNSNFVYDKNGIHNLYNNDKIEYPIDFDSYINEHFYINKNNEIISFNKNTIINKESKTKLKDIKDNLHIITLVDNNNIIIHNDKYTLLNNELVNNTILYSNKTNKFIIMDNKYEHLSKQKTLYKYVFKNPIITT